MYHPVRHTLAFGALIAVAAACSSDSSGPNEASASLNVVHATASLGAITVIVGEDTVISSLAFGAASGPVEVPAGEQRIIVKSGETVIDDFETTLTTEHVNAMVIAGGAVNVAESVIPDTGAVAPARANLRLVTVASELQDEPVMLDALINSPGVPPDSTARIGGIDSRIARYYSLMYFDPGDFRLRYVPAGTEEVLAEAEFAIAAGEVKVAVLERNEDGSYRVTIVGESSQ